MTTCHCFCSFFSKTQILFSGLACDARRQSHILRGPTARWSWCFSRVRCLARTPGGYYLQKGRKGRKGCRGMTPIKKLSLEVLSEGRSSMHATVQAAHQTVRFVAFCVISTHAFSDKLCFSARQRTSKQENEKPKRNRDGLESHEMGLKTALDRDEFRASSLGSQRGGWLRVHSV